MDQGLNRGYCLWVVPPNEGKVRKFRFTLSRVIATAVVGVLVGGMFVYMLGDYARLQLLRLENYLSISRLSSEHQKLLHARESLQVEVSSLKDAQSKSLAYEQGVRERLEQLSGIIESATALGVFDSEELAKGKKRSGKGNVGGAEVDCNKAGFARCSGLISSSFSPPSDYLSLSDTGVGLDKGLIQRLDRYIEMLKVIPFGLPAHGELSSGFGVRVSPFSRSLRMHEGIDFSMNKGSNIYSSAYGTVAEVRRNSTYGLMVDIRHNKRLLTRYAHLSKALVTPGQPVERGQIIALAGSSGRSTGPHLHFEVLVDGKPRDPARFLELAKDLKYLG